MTRSILGSTHRYVALDSLRGICACMVLLYHCSGPSHFQKLLTVQHGFLFVDFFFVLSGFVIATSYASRLANKDFPVTQFMWLRLWRVYPVHLVVLLCFLAFEIVFALAMSGAADRKPFEGGYSLDSLLYALALVQIFAGPEGAPWNGPSWSIAAEVWTYLLFAIAARYAFRWLLPVCIAIALAAPIYLFSLSDRYINAMHDGALVRCLFGFSLGVVAWYLAPRIQQIDLRFKWADSVFEVAAVALVIWFTSLLGSGPTTLAAPFLFFVTVIIFSRQRGVVSDLLLTRPLETLGTLSYSIYMVHIFLLYRFVNVLGIVEGRTGLDVMASQDGHNMIGGTPLVADILTLLFASGVLVTAYLSYRLIERPGQATGKRLLAGWRTRSASTVTT